MQSLACLCVTSICCIVNMKCYTNAVRRNARIGSNSFFASAMLQLRLTSQFSEFYHNVMDAVQDFALLYEPSLSLQEGTK